MWGENVKKFWIFLLTLIVPFMALAVKLEPQNKDAISLEKKAFWNLQVKKSSATVYKLTSFLGTPLSASNYGSVDVNSVIYDLSKDVSLTQGACNTLWGSTNNKTVYLYAGYGNTYATSVSDTSPSTNISGGTDTNFKIAVDGNPVVSVTLTLTGLNTGANIASGLTTQINAALAAAGQGARVDVAYGTLYTITSRLAGARSSVVVTDGLSANVADNLKIGVANSGVETAGIKGMALCVNDSAGLTTVGSVAVGANGYMSCSSALPAATAVRQIAANSLNCTGPVIGASMLDARAVAVPDLTDPVMLEVSGTLSQAQIIALHATPITVIPNPVAGKAIVVDEVEVFHSYSTAAYANGSDVSLRYKTSTTNVVLMDKGLVTATANKSVLVMPTIYDLDNSTGTSEGFNFGAEATHGIEVFAAGTEFDTGNVANVLKYRVRYHLITLQL